MRIARLVTVLVLATVSLGVSGIPSTGAPVCTEIGTAGNDIMSGTPGPDVLCGVGGADQLRVSAGTTSSEVGAAPTS